MWTCPHRQSPKHQHQRHRAAICRPGSKPNQHQLHHQHQRHRAAICPTGCVMWPCPHRQSPKHQLQHRAAICRPGSRPNQHRQHRSRQPRHRAAICRPGSRPNQHHLRPRNQWHRLLTFPTGCVMWPCRLRQLSNQPQLPHPKKLYRPGFKMMRLRHQNQSKPTYQQRMMFRHGCTHQHRPAPMPLYSKIFQAILHRLSQPATMYPIGSRKCSHLRLPLRLQPNPIRAEIPGSAVQQLVTYQTGSATLIANHQLSICRKKI